MNLLLRFAIITGIYVGILAGPAQAQRFIAVQSDDGSVTYFPQQGLQDALIAAQPGDVVYLPGGSYTCQAGCLLNKPLSVIGAGFHPDSTEATGTTLIASTFRLTADASGSFFSGLTFGDHFGGSNVPALIGLRVEDCAFLSSVFHSASFTISEFSSGISFHRSVLRSNINLHSSTNSTLDNCILEMGINAIMDAEIVNSIFLMNTSASPMVTGCSGCTIQNSIFARQTSGTILSASPTGSIRNCVFTQSNPSFNGNVIQAGLVTGVSPTELFVSNPNGLVYEYSDDYTLVPGSPALTAGIGGTECGIYGGPYPWKPGAVPLNPHISEQSVAPTTSPQGGLPVQIKVNAQGY